MVRRYEKKWFFKVNLEDTLHSLRKNIHASLVLLARLSYLYGCAVKISCTR